MVKCGRAFSPTHLNAYFLLLKYPQKKHPKKCAQLNPRRAKKRQRLQEEKEEIEQR